MTGYRSPSSKHTPDIDLIYNRISDLITTEQQACILDVIVFVGDDNASENNSCMYSRYAAQNMQALPQRFQMIDLIPSVTRVHYVPTGGFTKR